MRAALNSGPMRPVASVRRVIDRLSLLIASSCDRQLLETIKVAQPITAFGPEVYREAPLADEQAQLAADLTVPRQAKSPGWLQNLALQLFAVATPS